MSSPLTFEQATAARIGFEYLVELEANSVSRIPEPSRTSQNIGER
jgi:hypothetical protein